MGAAGGCDSGSLQSPRRQGACCLKKLLAWLERSQDPFPSGEDKSVDWWRLCWKPGQSLSVRIWNESQGLDWNALDVLVEVHGITEVEILIDELMAIRGFMEAQNG
jgi:hypothetical protein